MWSPTHIQLTVQRAKGLLVKGKHGTNDCFVVIGLGKEKFQTSVKEKSPPDVEWVEECEFTIPEQGNTAEVKLTVLHRNFLGKDEFLGQTRILLSDLDMYERPRSRLYQLHSKPDKKDSKQRGSLEVLIAFTVKATASSSDGNPSGNSDKLRSSMVNIVKASGSLGGSLINIKGKRKKLGKMASAVGGKLSAVRKRDSVSRGGDGAPDAVGALDSWSVGGGSSNADPGVISEEDEPEFDIDDQYSARKSGDSSRCQRVTSSDSRSLLKDGGTADETPLSSLASSVQSSLDERLASPPPDSGGALSRASFQSRVALFSGQPEQTVTEPADEKKEEDDVGPGYFSRSSRLRTGSGFSRRASCNSADTRGTDLLKSSAVVSNETAEQSAGPAVAAGHNVTSPGQPAVTSPARPAETAHTDQHTGTAAAAAAAAGTSGTSRTAGVAAAAVGGTGTAVAAVGTAGGTVTAVAAVGSTCGGTSGTAAAGIGAGGGILSTRPVPASTSVIPPADARRLERQSAAADETDTCVTGAIGDTTHHSAAPGKAMPSLVHSLSLSRSDKERASSDGRKQKHFEGSPSRSSRHQDSSAPLLHKLGSSVTLMTLSDDSSSSPGADPADPATQPRHHRSSSSLSQRVVEGGNDRPVTTTGCQGDNGRLPSSAGAAPAAAPGRSRLPSAVRRRFDTMSRDDLIEQVLQLQAQLSQTQSQLSHHQSESCDMKEYLDGLLVRVMEHQPDLLQNPLRRQTAGKYASRAF